ncbi:hypothetical protein H0O02_02310 [Candidatus Micrarchaeota archaeon]|nr:hypothetical protein [Candidatus Micrarchaeota archaeon]
MSILDGIRTMLGRKAAEPEFDKMHFKNYDDFYGHFSMFYPKDWSYDPPVVIDEGGYAVVFHSGKSRSQFRVGVETILPMEFNFRKYAKNEIESSSSGMVAKACSSKFGKHPCFTAAYEYESEGRKYVGKRILIYTGERIFSIFYTHPADEKSLEGIFLYMTDSLAIRSAKTKIFKRARP